MTILSSGMEDSTIRRKFESSCSTDTFWLLLLQVNDLHPCASQRRKEGRKEGKEESQEGKDYNSLVKKEMT
jgi:hypothetical protein